MFFKLRSFKLNDNKMHAPVETWYNAITTRHSRRRYTGKGVPDEILDRMDEISDTFHNIPGVRSIIIRDSSNDIFTGVIGSYGAIQDAPHSIVLVGDMDATHVQEATGYHAI